MQLERLAQLALSQTDLAVFWVDVQGCLVYANEAAGLALGYGRKELVTRRVGDIFFRPPLSEWSGVVAYLRDSAHLKIESRFTRSDGSDYPVEAHISLLREGGVELVSIISSDITERNLTQHALYEGHQRYRAVIESARDGFVVTDQYARIVEVNDTYCLQSGYRREMLLGMSIADIEAQESSGDTQLHLQRVQQQGGDLFETLHRRKNGEVWPVEVSVSYSPVEGGRYFSFVRDITERKTLQCIAELRQKLSEIVYQGDMDSLMRAALDEGEKLTNSTIGFFHFVQRDQENLSLQVWSTRTLHEMCFAEGEGLHYPVEEAGVWVDCIRQRQAMIHNDYAALPHKKGMPEGHPTLVRELTMPVFREGLIVAVMGVGNKPTDYTETDVDVLERVADMAFDFIERKRAEQHIEYMAYYDTLTGLPNRILLADRLNQAMAQHRRNPAQLAICYLDLDGFKQVNDLHGHDVGDELLVSLAQRLGHMLRDGDTLARMSGDEFLILLGELESERDGEAIVRRILEAVDKPFEVAGHRLNVSGSIGVTLFPTDDASADTLIRHADQAMYQAKNAGKGLFRLYDALQDRKIRVHHQILMEIDRGLEQQEFLLYYQPRIELRTGRLVGAEALVRWQHPERGLLLPGEFLPYLEGEPQEIRLGEWVIRKALDQFIEWQGKGVEVPVSVNISPMHLQSSGFVSYLDEVLSGYPARTAQNLELEVLETSAIEDTAQVAAVMQDCTQLGVRFSLDDFGTGYSSLTYFHRLPIDVLKIDQHFVRGMIDDPSDMDIVEGVLRLAEALRRPVVAEGVETLELGFLLLYLGCQYAQGYGISRPMAPERMVGWHRDWSTSNVWQQLGREAGDDEVEFSLKMAVFTHRRWLELVNECVRTQGANKPPVMDAKTCQFSRWYRGLGRAHYGDRPIYAFIPPKHARLHAMAESLLQDVNDGNKEDLSSRLEQINQLSEEFVAMLHKLENRQ